MGKTYVIDIEATGLNPSTAEIIQFTALEYSKSYSDWKLYNWYFKPNRPVPAEVTNITGLTTEFLNEASDGLSFLEQCDQIRHIFNSENILVGHNIAGYDCNVIKNNFLKQGVRLMKFPSMFDTMRRAKELSFIDSGKWIKLGELYLKCADWYGFDNPNKLIEYFCNKFNLDTSENHSHNAMYDVIMNTIVYQVMLEDLGI